MRTFEEYLERLRGMKPNIHMHGEPITRDDPRLRPAMNNIKLTFDLAQEMIQGFGSHKAVSGVHGGGSPIMEVIALLANYDLESKKKIAKFLAGIKP